MLRVTFIFLLLSLFACSRKIGLGPFPATQLQVVPAFSPKRVLQHYIEHKTSDHWLMTVDIAHFKIESMTWVFHDGSESKINFPNCEVTFDRDSLNPFSSCAGSETTGGLPTGPADGLRLQISELKIGIRDVIHNFYTREQLGRVLAREGAKGIELVDYPGGLQATMFIPFAKTTDVESLKAPVSIGIDFYHALAADFVDGKRCLSPTGSAPFYAGAATGSAPFYAGAATSSPFQSEYYSDLETAFNEPSEKDEFSLRVFYENGTPANAILSGAWPGCKTFENIPAHPSIDPEGILSLAFPLVESREAHYPAVMQMDVKPDAAEEYLMKCSPPKDASPLTKKMHLLGK